MCIDVQANTPITVVHMTEICYVQPDEGRRRLKSEEYYILLVRNDADEPLQVLNLTSPHLLLGNTKESLPQLNVTAFVPAEFLSSETRVKWTLAHPYEALTYNREDKTLTVWIESAEQREGVKHMGRSVGATAELHDFYKTEFEHVTEEHRQIAWKAVRAARMTMFRVRLWDPISPGDSCWICLRVQPERLSVPDAVIVEQHPEPQDPRVRATVHSDIKCSWYVQQQLHRFDECCGSTSDLDHDAPGLPEAVRLLRNHFVHEMCDILKKMPLDPRILRHVIYLVPLGGIRVARSTLAASGAVGDCQCRENVAVGKDMTAGQVYMWSAGALEEQDLDLICNAEQVVYRLVQQARVSVDELAERCFCGRVAAIPLLSAMVRVRLLQGVELTPEQRNGGEGEEAELFRELRRFAKDESRGMDFGHLAARYLILRMTRAGYALADDLDGTVVDPRDQGFRVRPASEYRRRLVNLRMAAEALVLRDWHPFQIFFTAEWDATAKEDRQRYRMTRITERILLYAAVGLGIIGASPVVALALQSALRWLAETTPLARTVVLAGSLPAAGILCWLGIRWWWSKVKH